MPPPEVAVLLLMSALFERDIGSIVDAAAGTGAGRAARSDGAALGAETDHAACAAGAAGGAVFVLQDRRVPGDRCR